MTTFLTIISVFLMQSIAMANNRISGTIVDDNDTSPLPGTTVVLLDDTGKQIMGTTSNVDGYFELKGISEGNYHLQCLYMGYDNFTLALTLLEGDIDLGEIRMKAASETINEVVVSGDAVIQKIDRQLIMPTVQQKKAATNGVSLLQHLQLSDIKVNTLDKSISTSSGEAVQLRINGVEATQTEIMSLRPEDVIRVEYHQQPGLRYGGANAVLDYIVRKRETGGDLSVDLTNGVYPLGFGNYYLSGKYNRGKSSVSALVQWSRRDIEWNRENEETFNFPDRTIINSERVASPNRVKYDYITSSLNYNYTDGDKSMLNIALRNDTKDIPNSFTDRNTILRQDDKEFLVIDREQSVSQIPSLDIYYQLNLKNDQHLYLDVVGTYLKSDNQRTYSMTESGQLPVEIFSKTEGNKYSVIGEAIYERPLWKGKFTSGIKHNQATMNNIYQGDHNSKVSMNTAESSVFAEYQSKIGKLNYTIGLGGMRTYYRQSNLSQEKYFFRPTLNLSYQLKKVFLRYNASISGYAPSLSSLSAVEQQMDTYQIRRGNPNLKSTSYFTNRLSGSYRAKWMNIDLSVRYSYDDKPVMEETIYENGMFIRTFDNQKGFHRLNVQSNIQVRPYKEYISIKLNPFFNRYISLGNKYTHTHNNLGFRGSMIGMYRSWIFMAEMNTSYHELFGETINKGEAVHIIAIGYNKEKWAIQAVMMNPFTNDYHQGVENLSNLAPNRQIAFSRNLCQMIMLNFSFNLSYGKQKHTQGLRIENSNSDNGILSGTK